MKIAIVNGVCKKYDAISESVLGTMTAAQERLGADTRLFAYACDFDVPFTAVGNVSEIVIDPYFLEADIILYHFGIYYDLFNAILVGNGHARQAVRYHNITPKKLLPAKDHRSIDKSIRQIANMTEANVIWSDSATNRNDLIARGLNPSQIEVAPLYVKSRYQAGSFHDKPTDHVQILYVGRFVESKGVLDLLRALDHARRATSANMKLDLVGNLVFSDPVYVGRVKTLIRELRLDDIVDFVGEVDDDELARRLARSHIFASGSYHEGFCVPLVEAMNARSFPIAYAAGNVPDLIGDFGELVEVGRWRDLGEQIGRYAEFFANYRKQNGSDKLPLRSGSRTLADYNSALSVYLQGYTFSAFCDRMAEHIQRLM